MQIFDTTQTAKSVTVDAGTILLLQGTRLNSLMVLESGMAEVLSCQEISEGESAESITERSHRTGLVKGVSVCGILGLYEQETLDHSIVTVSECIISNTPVEEGMLLVEMQKDTSLNNQVLFALVQRIESAIYLFGNYKYLWHKLASIQDSIALSADLGDYQEPTTIPNRSSCTPEDYSSYLIYQLEQTGGKRPELWDPNVFLGRIQDSLDLYARIDNLRVENMIDYPQYILFKRILRKPEELLHQLFDRDEPTSFYVFSFLSECLKKLLGYNRTMVGDIIELAELLFADEGWVRKILPNESDATPARLQFVHYLYRFSWRSRKDAAKLLRLDFAKKYKAFAELAKYRDETLLTPSTTDNSENPQGAAKTSFSEPAGEGSPDGGEVGDVALEEKYRNLTARILEFAEVDEEFRDNFTGMLSQIRAVEEIQKAGPELSAVFTEFAAEYWKLYEICFLKVVNTDLKSFVPGIMLHFGIVDERLVDAEDLQLIDEAYSRLLYTDETVPAMTLPYFLEKIYTGEVRPSMNEMGEGFREALKRQEKMTNREREAAYLYADTAEDKVRYELREVAGSLAGMVSGSKQRSVPIFVSRFCMGSVQQSLLDPEKTADIAERYRQKDYSLFYREVVCRHKFGTDIVQKEIRANFVLYPVSGSRMMMWQELDGTRKESPGRFFLPLYFTEKTVESIASVLAQFRWELSRSVAGSNWMDPVEGGLSGAYYDYIQFYKKNPNLSPTHKEKLMEFIRKTRSDRDRFTSDYLTWVDFEYDGKLRFNPVARDLFYRFVPFNAEKREEMARGSLFLDLETKRKNRARKEILRVESRMKKFEKSEEKLPRDLEDYYTFLNS